MRMHIKYMKRTAYLAGLLLCFQQLSAQKAAAPDSVPVVKKIFISGKVIDAASKKPIAGAQVSVKDLSAAISDSAGAFKLSVSSLMDEVVIDAEGFALKQVALNGRNNLQVSLQDETNRSFQQGMVMPLYNSTGIKNTAAAQAYTPEGAWKRPNEALDALLQGKVSGLNSIRRSGSPGVGANLFLRGYNSLYATNKPLIIVDGMIYDYNDYGQSLIANNYTNPLALINPQDIDNVTVVKDASSIYGTKGANGAILITTSRAPRQATTIDFGASVSFNQRPESLPVMDASQYRSFLSDMLQSKGLSAAQINAMPYMNDDTASNPDYYRYHNNTNWQDEVFENTISSNYFLKVTGGDNIATYALSVGYGNSQGIVSETNMNHYNTRFNSMFNFSKRFTGEANLSFAFNEQNLKDQGIADKTAPIYLSLTKSPFLAPKVFNAKGVQSPNFEDTDVFDVGNPSAVIKNMQAYNRFYRFIGSFKFNYKIADGFTASTQFGLTYDKVRENFFVPRKGVANDTVSNAILDSRMGAQVKRLFSLFSDTRLEYIKKFNSSHKIETRLGARYQHNNIEQDFALGYNSATDELVSVQNGLNALRVVGGSKGEWNWLNLYYNFDYAFRNKFFASFNVAMDASSRFGKEANNGVAFGDVKMPVMPSLSLGWLVSSENFLANSGIDLLKLRATYGLTGNDDIGNYTSRQTYVSQNLLGMQGLVRNGVPNPALQWETGTKMNAGIDFATFNERLNISIDAYKSKTGNMLVYEDLPAASGFLKTLTNAGSMENTGLELALQYRLINTPGLKLDLSANIGTYNNKVTEVPNDQFTTEFAGATILTKEGEPANQFYGLVAEGVFATSQQAATANLRKKNINGSYSTYGAGDVIYKDQNGDGIIDENDRVVIGDPNASLMGGFGARVYWKGFQLDALFSFMKGNDVFNYQRYRLESMSNENNQLQSVVNRWRAEGHVTNMPKATYGDPLGNSQFSNRFIEDGSYLRLRNLSISYDLDFNKGAIKNATVFASGNNLLTFTKYMGYDPEFSAHSSVFAQGIDTGLDPQFRSYTLGVRIGL
ncbi:MAG TPA: SusC/RagA family TonB-linked outer membrane protein [Phnomibacter sp.]|nr:SusC/RagA family TonB-linked outer membrane protein [Phnomibacter sp.]